MAVTEALAQVPRFSVIMPAHGARAALRESLESLLGQSHHGFEVLAVIDRSADAPEESFDACAADDPRVIPVRLPPDSGHGQARNTGLDTARGDYLLFLDAGDTMAPGALSSMAERLAETGDPDVLVYDVHRWDSGVPGAGLLGNAPDPVFAAERYPRILRLPMVAWNKAYRRGFVEAHGFAFPPGHHGDTPFACRTLLSAATVAALGRVCVRHRQHREDGIPRHRGHAHFDLFDQYERVFAFVSGHPDLTHWRPLLFTRMVEHYLAVLAGSERLPRGARPEFYHRSHEHYHRFRPRGLVPAHGPAAIAFALLARGWYPAYASARLAFRRGGLLPGREVCADCGC